MFVNCLQEIQRSREFPYENLYIWLIPCLPVSGGPGPAKVIWFPFPDLGGSNGISPLLMAQCAQMQADFFSFSRGCHFQPRSKGLDRHYFSAKSGGQRLRAAPHHRTSLLHRDLRWPPPLLAAVAGREYHYPSGKVMAKAAHAAKPPFGPAFPLASRREGHGVPAGVLPLIGLAGERTAAAGYFAVKVRENLLTSCAAYSTIFAQDIFTSRIIGNYISYVKPCL
mgnify:CR=1 FL=1